MKKEEIIALHKIARNVREEIIKLTNGGGCFIGASLSCVELIVYLYKNFLELELQNLKDPDRNYLFLSKGHDVPALYSMFTELGWLEKSRLNNHLKTNDSIYWHPNRKIPGVEFHSGSLGHLLSVSMGVALDCKISGKQNKIVVITGDGELNEGSIWEGLLVASAYKLDNLVIIVDRNKFQANIRTEELIPLEPLDEKFKAFGCNVQRIDGHNFEEIDISFKNIPFSGGKPFVIIADTIRGKGLPSIEEKADRWFCKFTHEEIEALLVELDSGFKAQLNSETMMVR
jgi:transketolase